MTDTNTRQPSEKDGGRQALVVNARSGTFREVIVLAFPLMISFLTLSIMGVVDTIILGKVGTAQQGGAGIAVGIDWTVASLFTGTMTVITTFVAQSYGAGKYDLLHRWVMTAMFFIIPMSLIMYSIIPFADVLVDLMRADPVVRPHVVAYMSIHLLVTPFLLIIFVFSGFLRGLGDMKTPMIITIIVNLINIPLDFILVFGYHDIPAMGVRGAALATLISSALGAGLYLRVYLGRDIAGPYRTRRWVWVKASEIKQFLKIGLPVGGNWMIEMVSWTIMGIYIASIDPAGLAAHIIVFQVLHFSFMPTVALSIAASTLVGQYLGAERRDLAKRSGWLSLVWGIVFMGVIGIFFGILRVPFIEFFNTDPEVVEVGSVLLLIAAFFQVFDALGIGASGILRGAGDTRFPLYAQLGAAWAVFIPLVFIFGQGLGWGVIGAWIAALIFIVVLGILMFLRVLGGKWLKMRVV